METKYIRVKEKKIEEKLDFYTSFGWLEVGERDQLGNGKVGITLERDKSQIEGYGAISKGERTYAQIARPYPLAAIITFVIASTFLALYFVMRESFDFYIVFLFASLAFYGTTLYLLIVFLIIFIKRKGLLKKVVNNVGVEAGTIRELPMRNCIKPENDDTWTIANNL